MRLSSIYNFSKEQKKINKNIIKSLNVISIYEAKAVLEHSLTKQVTPLDYTESEGLKDTKTQISKDNLSESTTH